MPPSSANATSKAWTRAKRIALIKTMNPRWLDLASELYKDEAQDALGYVPPSSGRQKIGRYGACEVSSGREL